jgi:transcriptional regulator with XRE-family HTH domain
VKQNRHSFADRLRTLREAANLTVQQLADASGVRRQSIWKLECGTSQPTWETVCAIAVALKVSTEVFRAT